MDKDGDLGVVARRPKRENQGRLEPAEVPSEEGSFGKVHE